MKTKYIQPEISILKAYGKEFIMQNGVVTGSQKTTNTSKNKGVEDKVMTYINDYLEENFADEKPYLTDSDIENLRIFFIDCGSNNIDIEGSKSMYVKTVEMIDEALQKNFREQVKKLKQLYKTKIKIHKKREDFTKLYCFTSFLENHYSNVDSYLSDSRKIEIYKYLIDNTDVFSDIYHIEEKLMENKDKIDKKVKEAKVHDLEEKKRALQKQLQDLDEEKERAK